MNTLKKAQEWAKKNRWFAALVIVFAIIGLLLFTSATYTAYVAIDENKRLSNELYDAWGTCSSLKRQVENSEGHIDILRDINDINDDIIGHLTEENLQLKDKNESLEVSRDNWQKEAYKIGQDLFATESDLEKVMVNSESFTISGYAKVKDSLTAKINTVNVDHSPQAPPSEVMTYPVEYVLLDELIKEIHLEISCPDAEVFIDDGEPIIDAPGTYTVTIYKNGVRYAFFLSIGRNAKGLKTYTKRFQLQ